MSLRYTVIAAICALMTAPFAPAIGNVDITGDLMVLWYHSENTYDMNDKGFFVDQEFGNGYYDLAADSSGYGIGGDHVPYPNRIKDETRFFRQRGHLYFTVDDLGGDNVMVRIGLKFDRAFENGNFLGFRDGGTAKHLTNSGYGSPNSLGGGSNSSSLDVYLDEAYLKIAQIYDSAVTLTLGRQYINIGDDPDSDREFNTWWGGSLNFGDSAWAGQSNLSDRGTWDRDPFDAIRADVDWEDFLLTLLYWKVDETFVGDDDVTGYGIFGTYSADVFEFNLYGFATDADARGVGGIETDFEHYVVGGRVAGDITDFLAGKFEVAHNWLTVNSGPNVFDNKNSRGWAIEAGLNFHPDHHLNPDIGFIVTWLEGKAKSDRADRAFLKPYTGKTYGEIFDAFAVTNLFIYQLNGGIDLNEDVRLSTAVYLYHADDRGLGADLSLNAEKSRDIGWEWDAYVDYQFNEEISTQFGGGIFFPGKWFDKNWGSDDEAYFLRGMVKVAF